MEKIFKKISLIFLSFVIALAPAYALTWSSNTWNVTNLVSNGASSLLSATKNIIVNGKQVIKTSTAVITPKVFDVSKLIAKGAGGLALSVAVEQILGSVDWVLDPANNRIVYTETDPNAPPNPAFFPLYYTNSEIKNTKVYTTSQAAVAALDFWKSLGLINRTVASSEFSADKKSINIKWCSIGETPCNRSMVFSGVANPAYDPNAVEEKEEKYLPLDVVAQKLISNADSGDINAQSVTSAAASDIVAQAENDDSKARPIVAELESNAQTQASENSNEASGESKPNDSGGTDLLLEFPIFCSWAITVCEAAQVIIIKPSQWATSISTAYTEANEWIKDDKVPDKVKDSTLIPEVPIVAEKVDVNFGASCPAPTTTNINFGGQSKDITILRYDFICQWSWVVKASVIALSSISAVFIVAGRKA